MFCRHFWTVLLVAGFAGSTALAADLSPRQAVIVSVREYAHREFPPLKYTDRDGSRLAVVLRKLGYEVTHLSGENGKADAALLPTAENIRSRLEQFPAGASKRDVALVVFTGHGLQPLGMKESFFCPQDADPELLEKNGGSVPAKPETLIGVNWALTQVHKKGYATTMVMVDACRDDPRADSIKGGRKSAGIQTVVFDVPDQAGLLLSCSRREYSWEVEGLGGQGAGAFLHHVIEGLEGAAVDKQGRITWSRLQAYVEETVPQTVSEKIKDGASQTPSHQARFEGVAVLGSLSAKPLVWPFDESTAKAGQAAWAKSLGKPVVEKNSIGMELVVIPPGTFMMGSPEGESNEGDEAQVSVTLTRAFRLAKTEVTIDQWKKIMPTEPWKEKNKEHETGEYPAMCITWDDSQLFCKRLSEREGRRYRLPTEAEWEWSCRGGTSTAYSFADKESGFQAEIINRFAWNSNQQGGNALGERYTHRVRLLLPNPFGLFDMNGNVWEWCEDCYVQRLPGGVNPLTTDGAESRNDRVLRGCGWGSTPNHHRSARRLSWDPSELGETANQQGFRPLEEIPQ
jgi:sulfatase modifying factor 1